MITITGTLGKYILTESEYKRYLSDYEYEMSETPHQYKEDFPDNFGDWLDSHYEREETLTVGSLIELLSQYDKELPVYVYEIGFTSKDSWSKPIEFGNDSVDLYEGKVRISVSNMGI